MEFLKELLQIQHQLIIQQVSDTLFNNNLEIEQFITKYDKQNYYLVKICNCKMKGINRVKIDKILSTLVCDHNPSLSR